MQVQPVAAVHRSQYKLTLRGILLLCIAALAASLSAAQSSSADITPLQVVETTSQGYLARIGYNDPVQLSDALERIKVYFDENGSESSFSPITMVVHGPEVEIFEQTNYETYKSIVDTAAQLSALGVLDIAVCETRVRYSGLDPEKVYAFVDKVPFGPAEVNRLIGDESYTYF